MSLADVLKPTGKRLGRGIEVYEGLSPADKETLVRALNNPAFTYQDIVKGLTELGHEITVSQLKDFAIKARNGSYELE